jgi:hypothetical protein
MRAKGLRLPRIRPTQGQVDVMRIVISGLVAERTYVPDKLARHRNVFHGPTLPRRAHDHAADLTIRSGNGVAPVTAR